MALWQPAGIVVADPIAELVELVRRFDPADPAAVPGAAERAPAALVRRRFGLSLPPPFADPLGDGADPPPVRPAAPTDGAAIAAVKWRTFGVSYRGVLPDDFLDRRDVVPPPSAWVNRATLPPSRQHALLVWGRPGEVHGYVDTGPARDDDTDPARTGEVRELYVDPSAQRRGGGVLLLDAAVGRLAAAGLADCLLWVMAANSAGRAFYAAQGWAGDGATKQVALGSSTIEELRYHRG